MLVSLILIYPARKPYHLFHIAVLLQLFLNLCLAKLRISSRTAQTALRNQHGSIAVRMYRTTLQHKRLRVIAVKARILKKALCNQIILRPICIQPVIITAPCVKAPVDASHNAVCIFHKGRCHIARPCIIGLKLNNLYSFARTCNLLFKHMVHFFFMLQGF